MVSRNCSQVVFKDYIIISLSLGQDVATFTPDQRTTAAHVSPDGQIVLVALAGRSDLVQLKLSQTPLS